MITVEKSPTVPTSALECQPVLEELVRRKGSENFSAKERCILALLRDELKRRLNLPLNSKLKDETFEMAEKAVEMFLESLHRKMFTDGMRFESAKFKTPRVKYSDNGEVKETRYRSILTTGRETQNSKERFGVLQAEIKKLEKRLAYMAEKPGEYSREEIAEVETKLASCQREKTGCMTTEKPAVPAVKMTPENGVEPVK